MEKQSLFQSPSSIRWEEFERQVLGNDTVTALLRSACGDMGFALDKLRTISNLISAKKARELADSLEELKGELDETLNVVDETTRLANLPTEAEKKEGVTEWGRIEELKKLKNSGG